ncbi:hypothetical protein [Nitrosopumilus sp.]|uniref:hypothetical protein n=1 Tax=Nitrosopumilus sp. TaxID=2024843 RepID=UPI003B592415
MSEIIIEKLLEQRDFYLNALKHLEFQSIVDPSEEEIKNIEKLKTNAITELKKVEQELAFLSSKNK